MIRLDMALKRKIGLENLQKFDYDQITIVITQKSPYDYDNTKIYNGFQLIMIVIIIN